MENCDTIYIQTRETPKCDTGAKWAELHLNN